MVERCCEQSLMELLTGEEMERRDESHRAGPKFKYFFLGPGVLFFSGNLSEGRRLGGGCMGR